MEESVSVEMAAGNRLGNGGEGGIGLALIFQLTILTDEDADRSAFVLADDGRPGRWETRVEQGARPDPSRHTGGRGGRGWRVDGAARGHDADLGDIGQFGSPDAEPCDAFLEIALGIGLYSPGDLADEVGAMACPARPAMERFIAFGQFAGGHLIERCDLLFDGRGHGGVSNRGLRGLSGGLRGLTAGLCGSIQPRFWRDIKA